MYSKATYVKPYIRKFIRVLGIENVGTLNKPKLNVIYAILANNGIKPIDRNQYGVPLYQYRDLDGLNDLSIIAGFHKWKNDILRKDIEISMRDGDKPKETTPRKKQIDMQTTIPFVDENDDKLYESLFSRKVYFTEKQIKYINEHVIDHPETMYVENNFGEKWKKLPEDSDIVKKVAEKIPQSKHSKMSLADVCEVSGGDHYVAIIYGGLNGAGKWENYLYDMYDFIEQFKDCWLIELENDVLDDTWTLVIGFNDGKKKLNEGAWGKKADQSDYFWDMADKLGEMVFDRAIKDLNDYVSQKQDTNVYSMLGIITDLITVHTWAGELLLYNNDDIEKKNKDNYAIKLIAACNKAFKYLKSDEDENRMGWDNFNGYKKELKRLHDKFIANVKKLNINRKNKADIDQINESTGNFIDPKKVLLVKNYLDDNFVRGNIPYVGDDGYPKTMYVVGLKGSDGNVAKNMDAQHLFYLLQDKFSGIYGDKNKRDKFLKQVMKDWYDRRITREGLLSVNMF